MDKSSEPRKRGRQRTSRSQRRTPQRQLARALAHGNGVVAVIGRTAEDAAALLANVVDSVGTHRVVHLHAVDASRDSVARALLADNQEWTGTDSASATRNALIGLLQDARSQRSPIVVVADDADRATAEQLDRLRLALEFAPDALGTVKLVLLGTTSLERTLSMSGARSLASRISARVQAPSRARRSHRNVLPARVAALTVAAVASVALMMPLLTGRLLVDAGSGDGVAPVGARAGKRTDAPVAAKPLGRTRGGAESDVGRTSVPPGAPAPAVPATRAPRAAPVVASAAPVATPATAPASSTAATPKVAASASAATPAAAMYALQVGAFRSAVNASRVERRLAESFAGVVVSRFERDGTVYHRVRVGGLADMPAAERAAAQLAEMGFDPLRIRTAISPPAR